MKFEVTPGNLKQATRLARRLRQYIEVSDVRLYRAKSGLLQITYEHPVTEQQDQLLVRAQRAFQMVQEGYTVAWVKGAGLVAGPLGQVYTGDLDDCSCVDRQQRRRSQYGPIYKGPCKHSLFRALDLLLKVRRSEQPKTRRRTVRVPGEVAAAV